MNKEDPDAVIIGGGGDMLVSLTRALPAKIPVVTFSSSSDLIIKELGKAADGTLITQGLPVGQKDLPSIQLYDRLCAKEHMVPSTSGLEGFLMACTVVEGLKHTGKDLTRSKFIKTMEWLHSVDIGLGPKHKLTFSRSNHAGLRGAITWTFVRNGQLEPFSDWKQFKKGS